MGFLKGKNKCTNSATSPKFLAGEDVDQMVDEAMEEERASKSEDGVED